MKRLSPRVSIDPALYDRIRAVLVWGKERNRAAVSVDTADLEQLMTRMMPRPLRIVENRDRGNNA
jgi:hypothetical protein